MSFVRRSKAVKIYKVAIVRKVLLCIKNVITCIYEAEQRTEKKYVAGRG